MRRLDTLKPLLGDQALAADPTVHASLSASAGTGKTHVLTARVLRLLLKGARPESILCLTFTKAAAAEMANRVGTRLAKWVRLKDKDLRKDLFALGEATDPPTLERARQLFAKVLDCPGGLKIQTIHSFCQSLLAAFPAEAGIVPGFQPIEGRAEQELIRRTLADLLAEAEANGRTALIRDVQVLSRRLGEISAVEYLRACARRPEFFASLGPGEWIEPAIRKLMGLPDGSIEEHIQRHCGDEGFDCDLLRAVADANRKWGAATGLGHAETIDNWLALTPIERAAALPELRKVVLTDKGTPRVSAGQSRAEPHYEAHAGRLATLVGELLAIQNGARLAAEMAAGLRAGQAFSAAYARAKHAAGVADFNDLIDWTRRLLAQRGMGDWVRYKLDRQVDHVLVDEAQDTNAAQWEIIERLVEEYFSGSSESEDRRRTLFMVGDFKQSIYGFQGTDPERFHEVREMFKQRAAAMSNGDDLFSYRQQAQEFRDLSVAASFRSAQPILDVVDAVIKGLGHEELALPEPPAAHRAHHAERPGRVELWQPFVVEDPGEDADEGEERWVALRDRLYAEALADRIKALVAEAPALASTDRPLSPGDVLVLVRSRGTLASLIVARLFAAGVPVAGVDRLQLHEPLAVQDLLSAVKFAVQPDDDLNLACLLVSPLIGWDQEQLRELAQGRKGSLWRELRRRAEEGEVFGNAHTGLSELLRIADFTPPSRYLETILSGPIQGRRKLYGRLGLASRDAIDELLNSALEFERNDTASLDRFVAWFSRGTVDVQRDPGQPGNEVRVMTVHGAKGLEASLVILADATADPARLGRTPLSVDVELETRGKAPVLRPRKDERCSPFDTIIADQERRDREEHWRLLYVAMTRAADRLIVAGVEPKARKDGGDPRPATCWHLAVQRAMVSINAVPTDEQDLVYGSAAVTRPRKVREPAEIEPVAVPDWARRPAPAETRPPRPLAPSAMAEDQEPAAAPSAAARAAARRGTLIHQLLERLAPVDPEARHACALRWLERSVDLGDAEKRQEIADEVCRVLSDPDYAPLFGDGSLGEAPLAATLPDGRVIAGTVDRLLIEESRVSVLDFKTGRVPEDEALIPASHRAQMAAYIQALSVIFPGREVTAALLYTAGPKLIQVTP